MVVSSQEKEQDVLAFPTTIRIVSPGKRSILLGQRDTEALRATDNTQFCVEHKTSADISLVFARALGWGRHSGFKASPFRIIEKLLEMK